MPETARPDVPDTIYAPATGSGKAAIAVIRISGARAHEAVSRLTGGRLPAAGQLRRRWIVDPDGNRIDDAMIVIFEEGASFTGEAMAEIHCHGSQAVITAICDCLARNTGCRLARPGEFTRRALEDGRIDLAEAEGLGDLIAAETEMQRRQALKMMSGSLSDKIEEWRSTIIRACALIEVSIDWVDEDIPEDVKPEVRSLLADLIGDLTHELARSKTSQRIRTGFEVAIIGAPNVGKSTLLNCLAGRDAAIVSDVPGTTRDVIEVRYDLRGVPVAFLDTAGIRDVDDHVESIGISRAIQRARDADLRICLQSPDVPSHADVGGLVGSSDLLVWSKSDLGGAGAGLCISAISGEGIEALLDQVYRRLNLEPGGTGLLTHLRHEQSVSTCRDILENAVATLDVEDLEITAERLRLAASHLEAIVGRIDTEAVLDAVFGSFCLGK